MSCDYEVDQVKHAGSKFLQVGGREMMLGILIFPKFEGKECPYVGGHWWCQ